MTDRTGHCLCGAVSFTAKNTGSEFGTCHCKMCQRWAGSSFSGLHVANADLVFSGTEFIGVFKSSDWAERAHCTKCGSALWYRLTDGPFTGSTSVAIGLLDDTQGLTLVREYFVDYRNSANALPEGRKQMTEADMIAMFSSSDGKA
jgi:hypothetical protein